MPRNKRVASPPDETVVSSEGSDTAKPKHRRISKRRLRRSRPTGVSGKTRKTGKTGSARSRRRTRRRYSDAERQRILSAARTGDLTAAQVQKQFGVTPVTYYSWRKKAKSVFRRGPGRPRASIVESGFNLAEAIRSELRAQIERLLPDLIQTEVGAALLGERPRRRRRRGAP